MPGCFLLQDLALEGAGGTTPTGPGTASYALPIPAYYDGIEWHLQIGGSATILEVRGSTLANDGVIISME